MQTQLTFTYWFGVILEFQLVASVVSPTLASLPDGSVHWLEVLATFLSSVVGSLAWPFVVLISIFVFKDHIIETLKNLEFIKVGGVEAKFLRDIRKATEEAAGIGPVEKPIAEANAQQVVELIEMAAVSPTGAIIEAWKKVEELARDMLVHSGGSYSSKLTKSGSVSPVQLYRFLVKSELLPGAEQRIF